MKSAFVLLLAQLPLLCTATPIEFDTPDLDRWMYPYNATPGTRSSALTFGAPDSPGFDERDGQFLIGYDTSTEITRGLAVENYQIHSVTLTLMHNGGDFIYDPTADSYTTYLDAGDAGYQADADAGRAIELFGVGYRYGYTSGTFTESTAFGPGGPPAAGTRSAYALGFQNGVAVDVSNSLDSANDGAAGFDPVLFSVGQAVGLSAGDTVSAGQEIVFELNLSDPDVMGYLQQSLSDGWAGLMVTSLHSASQGGTPEYPSFETKENIVGQAGILEIDVTVIPEPAMFFLWVSGGMLCFHFLRKRDLKC
ncbi:hypothetical protein P0Y35_01225 [Kiritimatiellaeota bacterium B1221]|nr:hypothetical protein [Kiritimatiellaeota bacterium B1221]